MKFETNKIYNLDVFDYLKIVPDSSIDLIITDPPYNMKKQNGTNLKAIKNF